MNATFVHELERLVVAQICNCFETVNLAAADALAEVLSRFLLEVGHTSHRFAETAGRTDVNASDVLCALSSLGSAFSRVIQDAEAFEIPFAHTLPLRLQIRRLAKRAPAFRELGDPAPAHFPKFLPALPDEHTFSRTPGELASAQKDFQGGTVAGHKAFDEALGGLKSTNDLCKRKRFGEYESVPRMDDVASEQYELWQASFSEQAGTRLDKVKRIAKACDTPSASRAVHDLSWDVDGAVDGAPDGEIVVSRGKVKFDLDVESKAKTSKACRSNQLQSTHVQFRAEHLPSNNADASKNGQSTDLDMVERLVKGKNSVFEST
mmetsp:Transcript_20377/g.50678  ORF Transcript_20377/g.50678 Transcript_20377/m.50678 type:complete len:321 (-) Transcript_20377:295-1257(-)